MREGGGDGRQVLPAPGLEPQGHTRIRQRMQPHGDAEDHAEGAERAREQLRQVIARDVLDHLAARLGDRAVGQRHRHADDQVARRPVAVAQRARVAGRDDAADRRRPSGPSGGSSASIWSACGEPRLRRGQRDARVENRRQVALVVLDDVGRSPPSTARPRPARRRRPSRASCPPRPGTHVGPRRRSGAAARRRPPCEAGNSRVTVSEATQNRSAIPAASSGCWRYGPGTSPQRRGVGITFSGFAIPSGSNAQRRSWNVARSGSENIDGM